MGGGRWEGVGGSGREGGRWVGGAGSWWEGVRWELVGGLVGGG